MVAIPKADQGNQTFSKSRHLRAVSNLRVQEIADRIGSRFGSESLSEHAGELLLQLTEDLVRSERRHAGAEWSQILGPVLKPGLMSRMLGISTTALAKQR